VRDVRPISLLGLGLGFHVQGQSVTEMLSYLHWKLDAGGKEEERENSSFHPSDIP
jgi:hypothetical protein